MDEGLRELERQWALSGSREDEEALVLARAREGRLLRAEGLYLARTKDDQFWLRFFPDPLVRGMAAPAWSVLSNYTPPGPSEIAPQLASSNPAGGRGELELSGAHLSFELRFYAPEFFHLFQRADEGDFLPEEGELEIECYSGRVRASGTLELSLERSGSPPLPLEFSFVPTELGET